MWKKSPDNYHVVLKADGSYELVHIDDMFENKIDDCDWCDAEGTYWDEEYEEDMDCCECGGSGRVSYSEKKYEGEDLGTLTALYLDLPNRAENRFTDDWTKTFDIRIGKPVTMPMSDCNYVNYHEFFIDRCFSGLALDNLDTVIDIGANVGLFLPYHDNLLICLIT